MIFANDHLVFQVLDVLCLHQQGARRRVINTGRHFCALSFREETDAAIICGGKRLMMQADSVTFFPADTDYVREFTTDRMIVIHFALYNYTGHQIEPILPSKPQTVKKLFEQAYTLWNAGGLEREYRTVAVLNEIFALLYLDSTRQNRALSPFVQQAVAYIEQHYGQPELTVPQVAAELNICEVYLRRLFNRELHVSPKRYILDLRLRRAAALLASGYYTVGEVARQVGFREEKYFSVSFRQAMGCAPSRYIYAFDEKRDSLPDKLK